MSKWREVILPHQETGSSYFVPMGKGVLGDEMGLGKTVTAIDFLHKVGSKKTLFVSKKEITSNLRGEIPKWTTDRPIFDLRGYKKHERETIFENLKIFDEFICIINIEAWRIDHDLIGQLIDLRFDAIVMDEAHHLNNGANISYKGVREIIVGINQCPNCKEPITPKYVCKRKNCVDQNMKDRYRYCLSCGHIATKIVIPPCRHCKGDANHRAKESRSIKNVLGMTGTILVNSPRDVFWVFHLISPEDFLSEKQFMDNFCEFNKETKRYQWKEHAKDRLQEIIKPYYLARTRRDAGVILPPQTKYVLEYDFDKAKYPEQWKAYQRLENQFYLDLKEETVGITEVVTQILRLRMMLVWPDSIPGVEPHKSFKLDIVTGLAEEQLQSNQRIIAFSHFREPLHELQRRLGDQAVVYGGSTPPELRKLIRKDFGPESTVAGYSPRWQAVLCNYRSAGEGLNLVGATQTVVLDEDWSPAKNSQAYGRTDRMLQKYETGVHIPRVLGTVDEWMAELNQFKQELVDGFNSAMSLNKRLINVMEKNR